MLTIKQRFFQNKQLIKLAAVSIGACTTLACNSNTHSTPLEKSIVKSHVAGVNINLKENSSVNDFILFSPFEQAKAVGLKAAQSHLNQDDVPSHINQMTNEQLLHVHDVNMEMVETRGDQFFREFVVGNFAGGLEAFITQPMNYIKTRAQVLKRTVRCDLICF